MPVASRSLRRGERLRASHASQGEDGGALHLGVAVARQAQDGVRQRLDFRRRRGGQQFQRQDHGQGAHAGVGVLAEQPRLGVALGHGETGVERLLQAKHLGAGAHEVALQTRCPACLEPQPHLQPLLGREILVLQPPRLPALVAVALPGDVAEGGERDPAHLAALVEERHQHADRRLLAGAAQSPEGGLSDAKIGLRIAGDGFQPARQVGGGQHGERLGDGLAQARAVGEKGGDHLAGEAGVLLHAHGGGKGEERFLVLHLAQRLADEPLGLVAARLDQEKGGLGLAARILAVLEQLAELAEIGVGRGDEDEEQRDHGRVASVVGWGLEEDGGIADAGDGVNPAQTTRPTLRSVRDPGEVALSQAQQLDAAHRVDADDADVPRSSAVFRRTCRRIGRIRAVH